MVRDLLGVARSLASVFWILRGTLNNNQHPTETDSARRVTTLNAYAADSWIGTSAATENKWERNILILSSVLLSCLILISASGSATKQSAEEATAAVGICIQFCVCHHHPKMGNVLFKLGGPNRTLFLNYWRVLFSSGIGSALDPVASDTVWPEFNNNSLRLQFMTLFSIVWPTLKETLFWQSSIQ